MSLSLKAFIEKEGQQNLAKKLGVVSSAVHHWRTGKSLPYPKTMRTIVRMSKGKLTYAGMIDPFFASQKNKPAKKKAGKKSNAGKKLAKKSVSKKSARKGK